MAVIDVNIVNVAVPSMHATLASLGCGLARTTGALIGLRFFQGAAAGLALAHSRAAARG